MAYTNCIILITGFPGSGKLSIAQELASRYEFKLIANYYINKNVLDLIEREQNCIPCKEVWDKIENIWETVLQTVGELSPPHYSFVITRPMLNGIDYSQNFYQRLLKLTEQRKSLFVPVRLVCQEEELVVRIQTKKRKKLGKVTDINRAKCLCKSHEVFRSNHLNELTINNTCKSPNETIKEIISHVEKLEILSHAEKFKLSA